MEILSILFCIAIGCVLGETESGKFGKEYLKSTEAVRQPSSHNSLNNVQKPNNPDENLRVNYAKSNSFVHIPVQVKAADLVETESSRNPLPVIMTSTMKPRNSKAMKSLEIKYLGKPAKHFKRLRKIIRRNKTRPQTVKKMSIDLMKSLLIDTADSSSREATNLASNTGKVFRRTRAAEVEDPTETKASYRTYTKLRQKLPLALRLKVRETEKTEENLLASYATSNSAPSNLLADYKAAKAAERNQLKEEVAAAGSEANTVINNYKALRKGRPWNYMKLRVKFKAFFEQPSSALTDYETLKQDELASIDSFLSGTSQAESDEEKALKDEAGSPKAEEPKAQQTETVKAKEAEIKDEAGSPKAEEPKAQQEETVKAKEAEIKDEAGSPKAEEPKAQQEEAAKAKEAEVVSAPEAPIAPAVKDEDPENPMESYDKYLTLSSDFNRDLKFQLMNTDSAEKRVLLSCIKSDYAPKDLLDKYYTERKKEIELLKQELNAAGSKAPEILASYKAIRKGSIWNYVKNTDDARKNYFKKVSAGRSQYEALKRKELDIDRYLNGSLQLEDKAPEKDEQANAEEIQRASAVNEEKTKEEKHENDRVKAAIKKGEDATSSSDSFMVQNNIRSRLPEALIGKMKITDDAEEKLLEVFAKSNSAPSNLIGNYKSAKANERESLKTEIKEAGPGGQDVLVNYKKLRKGSAWNSIKLHDKFKAFFEKSSNGLAEYENLKRDELSVDNYLKGPSQATAEKANKNEKIEDAYRMARAKAAYRAGNQDNDWVEEMERRVRAKGLETVAATAYRENAQDVVATTDVTKGTDEISRNPNVTSAEVTNAETTNATTEAKDSGGILVKLAILFAMVAQVIIAILILGPQKDKLSEWCKKMRAEETFATGETVPLHTRKVTASDTASKISRTALNTATL